MNIDLSALGLTPEDLQDRVIARIVEQFFSSTVSDENGEPVFVETAFKRKSQELLIQHLEASLQRLLAPLLETSITEHLTSFKIATTNGYGEPKREPETITEYMVRRIDQFMRERVDSHGYSAEDYRVNGKSPSYNNSYSEIRINKLIHFRMQDQIDAAMKQALTDVNAKIMEGLQAAVLDSLKQINTRLSPAKK